ncbi:hypothetical protein [Pasteuria penetrans]|uniref:hypothetical protein n=1 Tax=Pasteuria penetrans TaxID=86005 RepID=UPI000FB7730F|nr:hypothetical protein [Pasteuria penetrans]
MRLVEGLATRALIGLSILSLPEPVLILFSGNRVCIFGVNMVQQERRCAVYEIS